MQRVGMAEVLRAERDAILDAWERAVKADPAIQFPKHLKGPQLRDYVPALLDTLIDALTRRRADERAAAAHELTPKLMPQSHARDRLLQGYSLGGMLRELAHLRTQIVNVIWTRRSEVPDVIELHELEYLHGALDECMTVSAVEMESAASLERERIVAVLGHDLRMPLNAVKMAGSLIARGQMPDQHHTFATKIVTAADRMNRMISDLLDFASARSGSLKIERQKVDLNAVCQQVVDELRLVHRDRVIAFDASGNGEGEWDPERIAQVVSNLGANAIKYSPPNSTVQIRLHGKDDCVAIAIHNYGEPISEEEQREIFAPFRRGSAQTQGESGLGLGLFIALEMVRAHGGHIDVRSDAEHGTTFEVCLPR